MKRFLAAILLGVVLSWSVAIAQSTNNADINGISCILWIRNDRPFYEGQKLPACRICFKNESTNVFKGFLALPPQGICEVTLFDYKGKAVEKTVAGKEFGAWTTNQISDWFNDPKANRRTSFFSIAPTGDNPVGEQHDSFSIREIFQLKRAGEYTLRVRVRLVRNRRDSSGNTYLINWLPEAVAKFSVRPEDILAEK